MIALRSTSTTRPRRRREFHRRRLSAPQSLLAKRISDLHRQLISPVSDLETVKAAKRSLLRLLSDPMTLPVITTPPMELPVLAEAALAGTAHSQDPTPVCEVCQSALPARFRARREQNPFGITPFRGLRARAARPGHTRRFSSRRATITQPSLAITRAFS